MANEIVYLVVFHAPAEGQMIRMQWKAVMRPDSVIVWVAPQIFRDIMEFMYKQARLDFWSWISRNASLHSVLLERLGAKREEHIFASRLALRRRGAEQEGRSRRLHRLGQGLARHSDVDGGLAASA